jgi:hypothetical protein
VALKGHVSETRCAKKGSFEGCKVAKMFTNPTGLERSLQGFCHLLPCDFNGLWMLPKFTVVFSSPFLMPHLLSVTNAS